MRMKESVRKLCVLGILAALSVVLVLAVRFSVIPIAPWLEYDAGDVAIITGSLLFGPFSGVLLTLVASAIQALTVSSESGFWGFVMHFVSTSAFCLTVGAFYRKRPTMKSAVLGMIVGVLGTTLLMIPLNIFITPLFSAGTTPADVAAQILSVIIPFNLIKFSLNAVISFLLWRSLKMLLEKLWGKNELR